MAAARIASPGIWVEAGIADAATSLPDGRRRYLVNVSCYRLTTRERPSLHLLGSASPETVIGLAARHPDLPVPSDLDRLRDYYEFRDLPHFVEMYKTVASPEEGVDRAA